MNQYILRVDIGRDLKVSTGYPRVSAKRSATNDFPEPLRPIRLRVVLDGRLVGWSAGRLVGWLVGWMDGWMDGWLDG